MRFLHLSKNGRLPIDPMFDTPSKGAFHRPEFFKYFTKTFLNLEVDEIKDFHYSNGELFYIQEQQEDGEVKTLKMILDITAKLKNGKEVIIEIQVSKQDFFFWRLLLYMSGIIIEQFRNMNASIRVGDRYPLMKPVYGVATLRGIYFKEDSKPYRTIGFKDLSTNEPLLLLDRDSGNYEQMVQMTIIEIDKYNPAELNDDERFLYEFFLNKPYSSEKIPSILTATDMFLNETKDWTEEDIMDWIKEQKIRADERKSNALEFARNFLENIGLSPEIVAENLDLSLDEVLEIQKSLSSSSM